VIATIGNETSYTVTNLPYGQDNIITVQFVAPNNSLFSSEIYSTTISASEVGLSAPVVDTTETGMTRTSINTWSFTWSKISEATNYSYYIDGDIENITTVSSTVRTGTTGPIAAATDHTISIRAIYGSDPDYSSAYAVYTIDASICSRLATPSASIGSKNLPDSYNINIDYSAYADGYTTSLNGGLTQVASATEAANKSIRIDDLVYGIDNTVYIVATSSADTTGTYTSYGSTYTINSSLLTKLVSPIANTTTVYNIDSRGITWSSSIYADKYTYTTADGTIVETNDNSAKIEDIPYGVDTTISITAVYANNTDYSSIPATIVYTAEDMTNLSNPTITVGDKKSIYTYAYSWSNINTSSWSNITYRTKIDDGAWSDNTTTRSSTTPILSYGSNHIIYVQAVYTENEDYNSDIVYATIGSSSLGTYNTPSNISHTDITNASGTIVGYKLTWNAVEYYDSAIATYVVYDDATGTTITGDDEITNSYTVYYDVDDPASNLHSGFATTGSHSAYVKVEMIDDTYSAYNSSASASYDYDINVISAPIVTQPVNTTTISWDAVDYADYYIVSLIPTTGSVIETVVSGTENLSLNYYDLIANPTIAASTTYSIYVTGYSTSSAFYYKAGTSSNILSGEVVVLDTPIYDATNFTYATSTLTWSAVPYATSYKVSYYSEENSSIQNIYTTNLYNTWTNLAGLYTIWVTALRDDSIDNISPVYIDSEPGDNLVIGTLSTPTNFTRTANILSWDNNTTASSYIIYDAGVSIVTVSNSGANTQTYDMYNNETLSATGSHSYTIIAYAEDTSGIRYYSGATSPITCTRTILTTPLISWLYIGGIMSSKITWTAEANAEYNIYTGDNTYVTYTNGSTYTVTNATNGIYKYHIIAYSTAGDSFTIADSDSSNVLSYTVSDLLTPSNVTRDDTVISWSPVTHALSYTMDITYNGTTTIIKNISTDIVDGLVKYDIGTVSSGSYIIDVIAVGNDTTSYPNPRYNTSAASASISFGVLATPVLSRTDNIITWRSISGATSYIVYN